MRPLTAVPALLAAALVACAANEPPQKEFDGPGAFQYLQRQVAFGYRIPGTPPHEQVAAWLDSLLRARADTVVTQAWTHTTVKGVSFPMTNLIARFRPAATARIVFLAHWDTRPHADSQNSPKADPTKPVPGANDGASGVAVLLGMADALKKLPPAVGVDLVFVDGEDFGNFSTEPNDVFIGSRYYADHPLAGAPPLYAILFDMVGDKDLNIYQEGNSLTGAPEVVQLVWSAAKDVGAGAAFIAEPKYTISDDHMQLQRVGIKAIDLIDFDYDPWHTPFDDVTQVSAASLQTVGDVAMRVVRTAAAK